MALLGVAMAAPAVTDIGPWAWTDGTDGSSPATFDDLVGVGGGMWVMGVPDAYLHIGALLLSSNMEGTVNLTADVFNMGNDTANGYSVAFYDGVPGSGGSLIGSVSVPSLAAGGRATVSTSWSASAGRHTLHVRLEGVDSSDPTGNNYVERTVYILANVVAVAGPDKVSDPDASVTFNGSSSYAVGSTISNYTWVFSDSTTSYGAVVTHSFANSGSTYMTYTATLTVRDASSRTANDVAKVYVNAASATKPTADAGTAPSPKATVSAQFNGSMSQGNIVDYIWDFGDGTPASVMSPSHAFPDEGTFIVSLVVINNVSAADVDTLTVNVANNAPNVEPIADMTTDIGVAMSFLVLAYDVDGYIASYKWDFADGGTATTRSASHTWMRDGPQRVSYNVTDDDGAWVRKTLWVNVTNVEPKASFTVNPPTPNEGVSVRVDASGSIEPGNDIVLYEWDWNGDGTWDNSSATPVFNYVYYRPGAYNLTLRVTDGEGSKNTTFKRITVNNVVPTASLVVTPTSPQMEGVEFTFNASGSREPGMNITSYEYDWTTDGVYDLIVTQPIITYTFTKPTSGTYTQLRMRVRDEDNTTGQASFYYRITNTPPLVNDSVTNGIEDEQITIYVDAFEPGNNLKQFRWDFDDNGVMDESTDVPYVNHTFWRSGQVRVWVNVTDEDNTWGAGYVRVNLTDVQPVPRVPDDVAVEGVAKAFTVSLLGNEKNITGYDFDLDNDGTYDVHSATATAMLNFTKVGGDVNPIRCRVRAVDAEGSEGYWMFKVVVADTPPTVSATSLYIGAEGDPLRIDVRGYEPGMDITMYIWDWDSNGVGDEETVVPYATYTFDKPGVKHFRVTVKDVDNSTGMADLRAIIMNTIPSAVIKQPKDPLEGETITLDATDSAEPGDDILAYMWDFDDNLGNGWDLETDKPVVDHAWDSPGSFVIRLRVVDEDGSFGEDRLSIKVTDVAPIARLTVTVSPEDEASVLDGSLSYDPGGLDAYMWTVSSPGVTFTATTEGPLQYYAFDRHVEYTVGLTVLDGDEGKTAEVSVTVPISSIRTVPPVVEWTLPVDPIEGQMAAFSARATDPFPQGTSITQAIDYRWDFGDGSAVGTGSAVAHSFVARTSPYLIKLTVRDEDDDTTELWTNLTVGNLAPVVSPVPPILVRTGDKGETTVTATDITPGGLTLHLAEGSPAWASIEGMKLVVKPGKDIEAGTYLVTLRVRDDLDTETEVLAAVLVTKEVKTVAVTWNDLLLAMVLVLVISIVVVLLVARRRAPPAAATEAPPLRTEPTPAPYEMEPPRMRRDLQSGSYRVEPERVAVEMEAQEALAHEPTPAEMYPPPSYAVAKPPETTGFEFEEEIEEVPETPAPKAYVPPPPPKPPPTPPPRQSAPARPAQPPQQGAARPAQPAQRPPQAKAPPPGTAQATQQPAQKRYRGAGPPR